LSHEPYPFDDIWEPIGRMIDALGVEQLMWGTDWTRAVGHCSYHDAVAASRDTGRLSDTDRDALMGGTLQRIFGWAPSALVGERISRANGRENCGPPTW
jgi:L-fuconolactonase